MRSKVTTLASPAAGVEYYEKNVINQLLEFMHYYTTEVLQEAKIYREYAGLTAEGDYKKQQIDVNDVKLAIQSKAYQAFTRPLPMSVLKTIAQEKNSIELPKLEDQSSQYGANKTAERGARIDSILPKEYRMLNPNVQIYSEDIEKALHDKVPRPTQ